MTKRTEDALAQRVDLSASSRRGYHPGRPFAIRAVWLVVEALVLLNPVITSYRLKVAVLRAFGAEIGGGVGIKPNVHVKYPWHLSVGDHVWIGERSWIDNFVDVTIESHACLSQGAYLCTGNHDWADPGMGLVVRPTRLRRGCWVGAFARVAPGVTIGEGAVVALGSVLLQDADDWGVYRGNPATKTGTRVLGDRPSQDAGGPNR